MMIISRVFAMCAVYLLENSFNLIALLFLSYSFPINEFNLILALRVFILLAYNAISASFAEINL